MLLPWMVDTLERAGWQATVVVGPEAASFWQDRLTPGRVCVNPQPERGKTTSLAAGLAVIPRDATAVLITAVDQPRPASVYERLAQEPHAGRIVVPDEGGRRGHPVVIAASFRETLRHALAEDSLGLRGFLDAHRDATVRLPFPGVKWDWDLNTPESHERALDWFRAADAGR